MTQTLKSNLLSEAGRDLTLTLSTYFANRARTNRKARPLHLHYLALTRDIAQYLAADREARYGAPYADSDTFRDRRRGDAETLRNRIEDRLKAFTFTAGAVSDSAVSGPLPEAIAIQEREEIAPDYEAPEPIESTTLPMVRKPRVARTVDAEWLREKDRCMAIISAQGLPNSTEARCDAYAQMPYGRVISSFTELSPAEVRQFADSIDGLGFVADGKKWKRVMPERLRRMAA